MVTKPFHIVFVSPHSDPEARPGEVDSGGQCVYEYELGKSLSMIPNVFVTIVTRQKFNYPQESYIAPNCRVLRIECGGGTQFIPKEKLGPYLEEFALKTSQQLSMSPNIVHGHYWDGAKAALLLDKHLKSRCPLVWTPHSVGTVKRRNFIGIKNEMKYNFVSRIAWETFMMVQSDLVIVSTPNEKDQIEYDYGVYERKIEILAPGVELGHFQPTSRQFARAQLKLPLNGVVFMTLGRMDKRKGYNHCIDAFALFRKKRRLKHSYLVIFSGGTKLTEEEKLYKRSLKQLAKTYDLEHNILFRRAVERDKVNLAYSASDVYMCLSPYEPFGLTVVESMATGTPVIVTKNGGPANIIRNGETGYIVDPVNTAQIVTIMNNLVADQHTYNRVRMQGHKDAVENYAWEKRARRFYQLYQKIAHKHYAGDRLDFLQHISTM